MQENNIIIFHLDDSKNLRGGERQVLYLVEEIQKKGIENYIVARKNSPLYQKAIDMKIPVITLPYLWEWDIISGIILAYKIKRININKKKIIIHTHTGHTPATAIISKLFIKAKLVVHRRVDFKIKDNLLSRIKYDKADLIIAISSAIKKIMVECGIPEKKIELIHSCIGKDFANLISDKKEEKKERKIIGTLIALVPHKDPLNLIKAAQIALKQNNELIFLIGGDGSLKKELEATINESGISNNVKLLGYVDDNINFLKSIDIFVLPSKEEGLGSVLLEAMACGLPVIGTDAGGIPELIENNFNGFIVPKQNPNELANAIIKLACDEETYKRFSINSFKKVKEFTSEKMAEKTLMAYEKMLKNS